MTDYKEMLKELGASTGDLFKTAPELGGAFGELNKKAAGNSMDAKQKELVLLGIAIAVRCEGCIISHTAALVKIGATLEEITDVIGLAVSMGGGPSVVYGSKALACAKQLMA